MATDIYPLAEKTIEEKGEIATNADFQANVTIDWFHSKKLRMKEL